MAAFRSILSLLGLGGNGCKGAKPEATDLQCCFCSAPITAFARTDVLVWLRTRDALSYRQVLH
jgi:hypothetical protein